MLRLRSSILAHLLSSSPVASPAVKASAKLSHLKSPAKPDAVLAFLAGLGLSGADVAALVAKDSRHPNLRHQQWRAAQICAITFLPHCLKPEKVSKPNDATDAEDARTDIVRVYMALEFLTNGQITLKSDIYSLGVIITEILTGQNGYHDVEHVLHDVEKCKEA
ncbi:hypothetical protein D1007_26902 [Hordeum vulgare]|nr:hypothetical protein D1007_26902 [Hordeum vulgare]